MEQLPPTVFIAIGVIAAAFISGIWSLISLIISKDQKVSEFRQSWIDALRNDVAHYLGTLYALHTNWLYLVHTQNEEKSGKSFIKENGQLFKEMNSLRTRIILRLNPKEHSEIIELINDLDNKITSPTDLQDDQFLSFCSTLERNFQIELKKEWKRVKNGEPSFRYTRNVLLVIVVFGIMAGVYKYYA